MLEIEQHKNISNIISRILFVISSLCLIAFSVFATVVGILPVKIILGLWAGAAAIVGVLGFCAFRKTTGKVLSVILIITEALIMALIGLATYYFGVTLNFLGNLSTSEYQTEEYHVVVRADSNFHEIEDIEQQTLSVYPDTSDGYNDALQEITSRVAITTSDYGDFVDASVAMLEGSCQALLLKGAMQEVVHEIVPDFTSENLRIIYTVQINTPVSTALESQDLDLSVEPFNILVSGADTYGEISKVARSDVNMIITINPQTYQVLLTSIPRDYYVQLHGTTGAKDKLTHAGIYGIDMSRMTLEDLFDISIHYYIRVNFSTLVQIIDAIDGVDIVSDTTFTAKSDKTCNFVAGQTQHVYGNCALAYSRERYAYSSGDRHRVQNQQELLTAIIRKVTSSEVLISRYSDLLSSISANMQTNISRSQIYKLINLQLDRMPTWNIETISVDGTGEMRTTYSAGSQPLYVMIPDQDTVESAKNKITNLITPANSDSPTDNPDAHS